MFFQVLKPLQEFVRCCSAVGGGGVGVDKHVIHIVERDTLSQASMPKHWYLHSVCVCVCFFLVFVFVQHAAQGCATRKALTSVHASDDHAQNTGIYSAFVSLREAVCGLRVNTQHNVTKSEILS